LKKNHFLKKKLKNIRIWANKLNIIIYIINIIVGSGVTTKFEALGSDVATKPNTFWLIFFYMFYENKKLARGVAHAT
jgi:hypothetical protein